MSYITESQLGMYRDRTTTFSKSNIVGLRGSYGKNVIKTMVFLSHKHNEVAILQDVIGFLKKEGVDVYVDWMDEDMPNYTNGKTAIKLKERIKACDKFILVATQGAIDSKWCNWELGLGDAEKYIENIALIPINRTYQTFNGAEYLKIYPYIAYENGSGKYKTGLFIPRGYYVKTPVDSETLRLVPLKTWLENR